MKTHEGIIISSLGDKQPFSAMVDENSETFSVLTQHLIGA